MFKLSIIFVVRFYCLKEDVKYGFNFKLSRDKTIYVTTLMEATLSKQLFVTQWLSTLVKESITAGLFQHPGMGRVGIRLPVQGAPLFLHLRSPLQLQGQRAQQYDTTNGGQKRGDDKRRQWRAVMEAGDDRVGQQRLDQIYCTKSNQ